MKTRTIGIVLLVALMVLMAAAAAQDRGGRGRGNGWGRNSPYNRMYDPATVQTLQGEVTGVEYHTPRNARGRGVHLVLKSDDQIIPVHLGPEWFIENQDTQIAVGDTVKVTGSRVTYDDKLAIIAREVEKGDEVLVLRDEDGTPRWAGWRRR